MCVDIHKMVEKAGVLIGRDVSCLVSRGFVRLEMWEVVEIDLKLIGWSLLKLLFS